MEKTIALVLVGLVALWVVVPLVVAVVQLMRVRMYRPTMPAWLESEGRVVPLAPDQEALVQEIRDLGFESIAQGQVRRGPEENPIVFLRSDDGLTLCEISFVPTFTTGYFISFLSMDASGCLLVTSNRCGWMGPLRRVQDALHKSFDADAPNVKGHLAYHHSKAQGAVFFEPRVAYERSCRIVETLFDHWVSRKLIVEGQEGWHIGFNTAFEIAYQLMQARGRRSAPYENAALQKTVRGHWLALAWEQNDRQKKQRADRHDLKATILVGSLLVSLGAWGVLFNLNDALAIMAVLLVHEAGHALAMRWLGWRDVSMFFIPLFGGVAVGHPCAPAAWKQTVVLLAGPMPGLLLGSVALWLLTSYPSLVSAEWTPLILRLATMAVVINLLNLLPLSPLDGGRLIELSVFSQWPRARTAFVMLSVAALAVTAVVFRDAVLGLLALFVLAMLPAQWRMANVLLRFQGSPEATPRPIGSFIATRFSQLSVARQLAMLVAVLDAARVIRPARWERTLAIGAMVFVWVLGVGMAHRYGMLGSHARAADARTVQQRAFDDAMDAYDATEAESAQRDQWKKVLAAASTLPADDPRQVDVHATEAMESSPDARRSAMGAIIAAGRDGERWSVSSLLTTELSRVEVQAMGLSPDDRLVHLQEGVAWATSVAPARLAPTVRLRLRVAEVLDVLGRESEVDEALDELRTRMSTAEDCKCNLHEVISAQAWHRVSHDDLPGALKLLDDSSSSASKSGRNALLRDRAWVLLLDGRTSQGLVAMQEAVPALQVRGKTVYGEATMDLIYAMDVAGQETQAHELMKRLPDWTCMVNEERLNSSGHTPPWQSRRVASLQKIDKRYCPDGKQ